MAGAPNAKRQKASDAPRLWCISPAQAAELKAAGSSCLKLLIGNAAAGSMLGKGGSGLSTLEASTGCCIKISPMHAVYPGFQERVVAMAGSQESLESGLQVVIDACHQASESEVGRQPAIYVAIPNSSCGLVLGKKGSTQKEMSQRLGVTIQISKAGENAYEKERVVTLNGSAEALNSAVCELSRLVQKDPNLGEHLQTPTYDGMVGAGTAPEQTVVPHSSPQHSTNGKGSSKGSSKAASRNKGSDGQKLWCISPAQAAELQAAGSTFLKLLIGNAAAELMLGPDGSDLPTLESETGCCMKISPTHAVYPGFQERVVAVAGSQEALEYGLQVVVDACHQAPENDVGRPPSIYLAIPNSSCGLVLGKQGSTQKEMVQRLGVNIRISKAGENAYEKERVVTLNGSPEGLNSAVCEISRLVQRDPNLGEHLQTPTYDGMVGAGAAPEQTVVPPSAPQPSSNGKDTWSDWSGSGNDATLGSVDGFDPQCTIYFEVSDAEAGHIIGKGGSFQQTVCQQTGAKIEISKKGDYIPGTTNRQAHLHGAASAVHAAHLMILKRAAEVVQR